MSDMQVRELFGIPLYKKKYEYHNVDKELMMKYLENEEIYSKNTFRDTLKLSHPNIHKEVLFAPFVDFVKESLTQAFIDLGYEPSFEITAMWGTRHIKGGFHHRHTHGNAFLAGVYYFDGPDSATGTNFYNPVHYHRIMIPARIPGKPQKFKGGVTIPWEEGNLIIFPAWLMHDTNYNSDDKYRTILSFNCMPVGKTTYDTFDRYNYQSIENADLINYKDELDGIR